MNRYFLFLFLLTICCSILFSCERNSPVDSAGTSIKMGIISKAMVRPGDGTTCRIIIHKAFQTKDVTGGGMYVFDKNFSTEYYRPARLGSKGEFLAYDDLAGVPPSAWPTNNSGVYATYIVPGYAYDSDCFIAYVPENEVVTISSHCFVSNLDINGVYKPIGHYLYDIRSQVACEFYKSANENVKDFTITNPRIVGTGNPGSEVKYNPITGKVHVSSEGERPVQLTSVTNANVVAGRIKKYTTLVDDYMFVSSGTYEPNPKLTLQFTLNQDSISTDVVLPINESFKFRK